MFFLCVFSVEIFNKRVYVFVNIGHIVGKVCVLLVSVGNDTFVCVDTRNVGGIARRVVVGILESVPAYAVLCFKKS